MYKRQQRVVGTGRRLGHGQGRSPGEAVGVALDERAERVPVSYTHLRAHETVLDLVCRLLLEKKN